jgi:hypothetical protein
MKIFFRATIRQRDDTTHTIFQLQKTDGGTYVVLVNNIQEKTRTIRYRIIGRPNNSHQKPYQKNFIPANDGIGLGRHFFAVSAVVCCIFTLLDPLDP